MKQLFECCEDWDCACSEDWQGNPCCPWVEAQQDSGNENALYEAQYAYACGYHD